MLKIINNLLEILLKYFLQYNCKKANFADFHNFPLRFVPSALPLQDAFLTTLSYTNCKRSAKHERTP